ncbi:hypothetical protein [Helicobacter sp. T3_23-1056]
MGITQMIHNAWLSIQKPPQPPSTPLRQNNGKSSPSPTQQPQKTKTPSFLGRLFSTTRAGIYNAFKPHNTTKAKTHDTRTKNYTRH